MRKIVPLVMVVVLVAGSAFAEANLEIPSKTFDFGFVPQQSTISTDYWLKSTGSEELRILKVIPGCGCTKAPLEKDVLASGDSTRLEVIFDSKRFTNRVTKKPRIQTNVGDQTVEFMAMVVRRPDSTYPVIVKPYKLDLTQQGDRVRDEIRFTIRNVSDQPLDLGVVATRDEYFSLELPKSVPAGGAAEGVLKLTEKGIASEFEKSFTFEVSDATTTRYTLPVKRSVQPLSTAPGFGAAPGGK